MRIILALPLLMVAACNVERDTANDSTTMEFNQERIEGAAEDVGNAARDVAAGAANVASATGDAIGNEVGDGADADANRNEAGNSN
jgi:hypothetical protein